MSAELRENIAQKCRKICPFYHEDKICQFAESGGVIAYFDTSQNQDGSRGIALFEDKLVVNPNGERNREIPYDRIKLTRIISSFEDSFADDLAIIGKDFEVVISDYSLDKAKLDELIRELVNAKAAYAEKVGTDSENRHLQTEEYAEIIAQKLAENALNHGIPDDLIAEGEIPVISEIVIPKEKPLPEGYKPAPIPDDGINWISGRADKTAADVEAAATESEARTRIQNMSREETLSYLAQSLSEINDMDFGGEGDDNPEEVSEAPSKPLENPQIPEKPLEKPPVPAGEHIQDIPPLKAKTTPNGLTVEPIWGDIYIKASRNLREVIQSGKLSMEQIENELRDKMLDSARVFAEITANESEIPAVLVTRIHELKTAADNFDRYFNAGEDVAVRAMFFMMYQMLSYSDRIVETPETKERLNDFFKQFGSAGISLSMLDMRV